LKRERAEVYLNYKKLVRCDDIGEFEEDADFEEIGDKFDKYAALFPYEPKHYVQLN
jgi:hypothetical protein